MIERGEGSIVKQRQMYWRKVIPEWPEKQPHLANVTNALLDEALSTIQENPEAIRNRQELTNMN